MTNANGLTCFLTGATSGIGQAAAIDLASQGYSLYLTARSREKAAATTRKIKAKMPEASIEWFFGDLAKLKDVRRIAHKFLETGQPIDLLFLNAGLCQNTRVLTEDGIEMMFAVNHLAPFLLTHHFMDRLCAGEGETRIVVTASGAYSFTKTLNLEDVNCDERFKTFEAYGNSKLANILFTKLLAKKLEEAAPKKTFTVNCFHPGFVGTGIGTQVWFGRIIMALCRPFVRSPAKGAETGLYLATSPDVEGQTGGYYVDCELTRVGRQARDESAAAALWAKSLGMVSDFID